MYKQNYFNKTHEIKTLMDFIQSDLNQTIFTVKEYQRNDTLTLVKFKYDENNIFIYYISNYNKEFRLHENFQYGGFYNLLTDTFYDADFNIKKIISEDDKINSTYDVIQEINRNASTKICEIIDNFNDCSLEQKAKELLDESDRKRIEDYRKYYAEREAINMFWDEEEQRKTEFNLLSYGNYNTEDVVNYLNGKDKFIEFKAREYIEHNLASIYTKLLCDKLAAKEYKKIINDKENILHTKKKIADCITNQKTVNVTILKNDIEFTFKTDASSLKSGRYHDYYWSYDISAKDRELFHKNFGSSSDYTADEIEKITYCKKVIYKKAG